MSYYTEVVVYKSNRPVSGARVSLEFSGLLSGGFTKDFYTNSAGAAQVQHESQGTVKVYVDGDHSGHRTTGQAPGRILVYL